MSHQFEIQFIEKSDINAGYEDIRIHTSSSLAKYNRCPKLWSYYYRHKVNPPESILDSGEAISIGSCIHECFDTILTNIKLKNDPEHQIIEWIDVAKKYPEHISSLSIPIVEVFMLRTSFFEEIIPVEVEQELYADFNEYSQSGFDSKIRLGGKLDAIVEYDNKLWVLDHKTSKRLPRENQYELHQQFDLYCWLARKSGFDIHGILVNAIKQTSIKRRKDESFEDLSIRIRNDMMERIDDKGNNQDFFRIYRLFKPEYKIEESMNDIKDTIMHIEEDVVCRKNSGSCFYFNKPCEFFDVCRGAVDLETLTSREKEHPELNLI